MNGSLLQLANRAFSCRVLFPKARVARESIDTAAEDYYALAKSSYGSSEPSFAPFDDLAVANHGGLGSR